MKRIRVWDLPVRIFHWTLVALVVTAVVTQEIGGNAMQWHFRTGYAILTLVLFRIIWGLVGPRYVRFSNFLPTPARLLDYLRGRSQTRFPGHNPLGSLSIVAMLGVLLLQAGFGLFSNDDIASEGPLVKFISKELSDQATWLHKEIGATLIFVLVGLHVAAILWYLLRKKENLVVPMLTGDKKVDFDAPDANDSWGVRLFAAVLLALCASAVYLLVNMKP
ncbi:cytochrome b/b6 domain-containing protein [Lacisediminimonas profundi]|uniref:cytochrome b/b6 domain-containing protein n=1 Tax=Lacisediminimonas profundi TaxID=2603856 RepID=UPI001F501FE6|nr:cytochrome b/b6 domain-containing protein [Lacisediminimonas profundi]